MFPGKKQKEDKIALQAYKTFRYVLDRIYDPKIQKEVIRLGGGYPIMRLLPLPEKLMRSLTYYYKSGWEQRPGYDAEGGATLVRETIARHENKKYGANYTMDNIALVAGATYGTNRIVEILFDDQCDKEIVIIAPTFYKGLHRALSLCGLRSVVVPAVKNFVPGVGDIISQLGPKTLAVFVCNPGNPSGKYIKQQDMKRIIEVLRRRGIYLIIDEVQDNFNFTGGPYRYGRWIKAPNVIRIRSVSKDFVLAEYRIGYVVADSKIIGNNYGGLIELVGYDIGNPPPVLNHFFVKAMDFDRKRWERIIARQKNLAMNLLSDIPAIKRILVPDACFNLTFRFSHPRFKRDVELFDALIDKKVAMMPLSGFGYYPEECWMRLTFASPDFMIKRGVKILADLLK